MASYAQRGSSPISTPPFTPPPSDCFTGDEDSDNEERSQFKAQRQLRERPPREKKTRGIREKSPNFNDIQDISDDEPPEVAPTTGGKTESEALFELVKSTKPAPTTRQTKTYTGSVFSDSFTAANDRPKPPVNPPPISPFGIKGNVSLLSQEKHVLSPSLKKPIVQDESRPTGNVNASTGKKGEDEMFGGATGVGNWVSLGGISKPNARLTIPPQQKESESDDDDSTTQKFFAAGQRLLAGAPPGSDKSKEGGTLKGKTEELGDVDYYTDIVRDLEPSKRVRKEEDTSDSEPRKRRKSYEQDSDKEENIETEPKKPPPKEQDVWKELAEEGMDVEQESEGEGFDLPEHECSLCGARRMLKDIALVFVGDKEGNSPTAYALTCIGDCTMFFHWLQVMEMDVRQMMAMQMQGGSSELHVWTAAERGREALATQIMVMACSDVTSLAMFLG